MNDAFAQIADPIFRTALELRRGADRGEHRPLEAVKADLLSLFAEAEQKAATACETAANFSLARYALVYWTDEVLINSNWSHAEEWRNHILEWEYFRENVGGEKFYEKAAEAERLSDTDPLEVFFLCVALGFQGKLAFSPPELRRWVERVYGRLAGGSQHPERFLPDDDRGSGLDELGPLPGQTRLLAASVLVSATALVTLAGFLLALHWF